MKTMNREEVIEILKSANRPVSVGELSGAMKLRPRDKRRMKELIADLVTEGALIKTKGNLIGLPKRMDLVSGIVTCHRDGYGFVIPDDGSDDLYIPPRNLMEVMHGDKVMARVDKVRRGKKEGRIVRILERGTVSLVGRFESNREFGYVVPMEQKILHDIYIPKGQTGKAKPGQVVVAEITNYPSMHRNPEGKVTEVLGNPGEPDVEVMSIVRKHGILYEFPDVVKREAVKAPQAIDREEIKKRKDLRDMNVVTIDGEKARDFDDAVAVRLEENGDIRLWVSIADVSFYVKEGSALDSEAFRRGTSTYFPDRAIPMLPEELSNGICSLNPKEDRLTLTAEMLFDRSGKMKDYIFYSSVIKSVERLTYTAVRQVLVDEDPQMMQRYAYILDDLKIMKELCLRLNDMRKKRGAIDFDLPEPQIILDIEGRTEDIIKAERNLAHQIIEEFMLAANEAVASHMTGLGRSFIYRIHEEPDEDKVAEFRELVHNLGYTLYLTKGKGRQKEGERRMAVTPTAFQKLLEEVKEKPEEKLVNTVMLRSMKQARYSHENAGHFGLAATDYTHFTSPIRRYPDLIVHRMLKEAIGGTKGEVESGLSPKGHWQSRLPEIADHCSKRERVSMEAEREIVELKKVQFMKERAGDEFDGIISGVISFGFFVELTEYFVEGLVHISTLGDDYYHYSEREHLLRGEGRKRTFRIGDMVRVRVESVSEEKREIDFSLVEEVPMIGLQRKGKKGRRRSR